MVLPAARRRGWGWLALLRMACRRSSRPPARSCDPLPLSPARWLRLRRFTARFRCAAAATRMLPPRGRPEGPCSRRTGISVCVQQCVVAQVAGRCVVVCAQLRWCRRASAARGGILANVHGPRTEREDTCVCACVRIYCAYACVYKRIECACIRRCQQRSAWASHFNADLGACSDRWWILASPTTRCTSRTSTRNIASRRC